MPDCLLHFLHDRIIKKNYYTFYLHVPNILITSKKSCEFIQSKHEYFYLFSNLTLSVDNEPIKKVRGFSLLINHIKAMFMKLVFSTWRSKVTSSIQLTWPIINIIISIILSRSWQFLAELPPLTLNLEKGFKRTQTILAQGFNLTDGRAEASSMNAYKDYFKTSAYSGMTLTDIGAMDMGKFYAKLVS